jgi:hypothetical protein
MVVLGGRRIWIMVQAVLAVTIGLAVATAQPAGAAVPAQASVIHNAAGVAVQPATSLAGIVCGGAKAGSGWKTYPTGGYVGRGCGAGIDYVSTPTTATSTYLFGFAPGGLYSLTFSAWIPTVHATAYMDFALYCGSGQLADYPINEAPVNSWQPLFKGTLVVAIGSNGCQITIKAWSGMAHVTDMGLDAISLVS